MKNYTFISKYFALISLLYFLFILTLLGCATNNEQASHKNLQYIGEFHLVLIEFSQKLPSDNENRIEPSVTTDIIEVEYWIDRLKSLDNLSAHNVRNVHDVQNIINLIKPHISMILDNMTTINDADKVHDIIQSYFPPLLKRSKDAVDILNKVGASERQLYLANRLTLYTKRMQNNLKQIVTGVGDYSAADKFGRDALVIARILEGLLKGSDSLSVGKVYDAEAVQKFRQMVILLSTFSDSIARMLNISPALFELQKATRQVIELNKQLKITTAKFG